jgi:hypothetical protein
MGVAYFVGILCLEGGGYVGYGEDEMKVGRGL